MNDTDRRCGWARHSEAEQRYHDTEWGRLKLDDRTLFEFVVLESAQAGLSWRTVLNKREGYRRHYQNFDPQRVARFAAAEIDAMLADPGVIRNRAKIEASIGNARVFIAISREFGGFAEYLGSFTDRKVIVNQICSADQLPADSELSRAIARDLKKRGFRFFGSTIVYAFLQACGYINDHLTDCSCYQPCIATARRAGWY